MSVALADAQPPAPLTTVEKLRGLPWSISANVANTIFCQFTFFGSVFPLFLSELGFSKSQMGFLFSLMPFCGLVSLFVAPAAARFGYKNFYMTFWGIRKIFTALLLLTPWVLAAYGLQAALILITAITAVFALCRALAETARVPWVQEFVPGAVQGKYTATSNIFTSLAGFLSVAVAGYVLGQAHTLTSYLWLMAAGVFFGFICVWLTSFIPGGAPVARPPGDHPKRELGIALRDRNFLLYLGGVSLIVIATTPIGSFFPLFMQEEVGLSAGNIVLLQMGSLFGGLVTSYLWGWAADRYGSKPVMLSGINLRLLVPLLMLLIPANSALSLPIALAINLIQGAADMGWGVGSTRMLYVSVVPPEKKMDYLAVYSAWVGIVGGVSQLAGGWALDAAQGLSGQWGPLSIDAYTPLLIVGFLLTLACNWVFRPLRGDHHFGMRQFTGIFLRGNPFLAMGSLIRYQFAHDEEDTVRATAQLGQANSRLTVDELLEALADPRFNVRFEAIVTIARMPPDSRLVQALIDILNGTELALETVAAWALGRMGRPEACEPLREKLDSPYQSIRAHSARALGKLKDATVIPLLLERLATESDKGLQMAYSSALGNLGATAAAGRILEILAAATNRGARLELALALARLVGDEHHYIQLVRATREDLGTAVARDLTTFRRKLEKAAPGESEASAWLAEAADAFAHNDQLPGCRALAQATHLLAPNHYDPAAALILQASAGVLAEQGNDRVEYLLLLIHTLAQYKGR
jgi:Na+/melibiose symporter-like transporter